MPSTLRAREESGISASVAPNAAASGSPKIASPIASILAFIGKSVWPIAASLVLTAAMTVFLIGVALRFQLNPSIAYLVPVLISAVRWGAMAGVVSALGGAAASAFFFYPPIYDLRVHDPQELLDLMLFLIVAGVTSHLANTIRNRDNELLAHKRAEVFRDALIGSVSHELRTPLSSIVSSTFLLAKAPVVQQDPQLSAIANDVKHEAERLNDDIQNLLDASRITSSGVEPKLQWADVTDILNAAIERKEQKLASHEITLDIHDDLPLAHVDPVLIEQAIGQVLDNAAKYSPPGSPIKVVGSAANGRVSIAVKDQGGGLTREELGRIWDRFYRSPRHMPQSTGSGLGLWIARAFVSATGGTIDAVSEGIDHGTTVTISLPAPGPHGDDVKSDD